MYNVHATAAAGCHGDFAGTPFALFVCFRPERYVYARGPTLFIIRPRPAAAARTSVGRVSRHAIHNNNNIPTLASPIAVCRYTLAPVAVVVERDCALVSMSKLYNIKHAAHHLLAQTFGYAIIKYIIPRSCSTSYNAHSISLGAIVALWYYDSIMMVSGSLQQRLKCSFDSFLL